MPLEIVRNDITKMTVDVIVNAANSELLGGGGVDGAIHRAAGPQLLEACKKISPCPPGEVVLTKGYLLAAKYVIHTVGPIWKEGTQQEEEILGSCYRKALLLAKERGFESIALPLISTGAYGFPKEKALQIAVAQIRSFLSENEMQVSLVVFDSESFAISENRFTSIQSFIDDYYVEEHFVTRLRSEASIQGDLYGSKLLESESSLVYEESLKPRKSKRKLEDLLEELEESFVESLFRRIDEKGLTEVETYKRANLDRKLFSKIRSDKNYKPSKGTVLALAIALRLNLDETKDLLQKVGYALSRSSKFDLIVQYFIDNEVFDIYEINEALFAFDQMLLGSVS